MWSQHGANPCRRGAPSIGAYVPGRWLVIRALSNWLGLLPHMLSSYDLTLLCVVAGAWWRMWLGKCSKELPWSAFTLRSLST